MRRRGQRGRATRRGSRVGDRRRRALLLGSVLALVASMIVSVRRTADGRRLVESLNALQSEESILRAQLAEQLIRVDSLSSRERIAEVAASLGLRAPRDDEIVHLHDVAPERR